MPAKRKRQKQPLFSKTFLLQSSTALAFLALFLAYTLSPWPAWLGEEPLPRPNWPIWVMVIVVVVLPNIVIAKSFKKTHGDTDRDTDNPDHSYDGD